MKRLPMLMLAGLLSAVFCGDSVIYAQEDQTSGKEFYLPSGDAAAGRQAFIDLKCYTCHQVLHDSGLPATIAAQPGAVLQFSEESAEAVAGMIVSPSHSIAGGFGVGTPEDVQFSRMGDFSDTMTVRQLRDIVSYLRNEK